MEESAKWANARRLHNALIQCLADVILVKTMAFALLLTLDMNAIAKMDFLAQPAKNYLVMVYSVTNARYARTTCVFQIQKRRRAILEVSVPKQVVSTGNVRDIVHVQTATKIAHRATPRMKSSNA